LVQIKREQDGVEQGNIRDSLGRYEGAISSYDSAFKIDPNDADAWFDKAMTLKRWGNPKKQRVVLRQQSICTAADKI
jgi:Flp pilus assembly protein TadD